jgi:hypothetical protein
MSHSYYTVTCIKFTSSLQFHIYLHFIIFFFSLYSSYPSLSSREISCNLECLQLVLDISLYLYYHFFFWIFLILGICPVFTSLSFLGCCSSCKSFGYYSIIVPRTSTQYSAEAESQWSYTCLHSLHTSLCYGAYLQDKLFLTYNCHKLYVSHITQKKPQILCVN